MHSSSLSELSKSHLFNPGGSSSSTSEPPNGLLRKDLSPAEILAAIPRYGTNPTPEQNVDTGLEDNLFADQDLPRKTEAMINRNAEPQQLDYVRSNDKAFSDGSENHNQVHSKSHLVATEPQKPINEITQLPSSTPESDRGFANSSLYPSGDTDCSSYSDQSIEGAGSEASFTRNNASPDEPDLHTGHLIPSDDEPRGYSCFCGCVDNEWMIACDGNHGSNEAWFHYKCVGIDIVPEGQFKILWPWHNC